MQALYSQEAYFPATVETKAQSFPSFQVRRTYATFDVLRNESCQSSLQDQR